MPLFITQFLGAFNDNFLKSAMLMLITFRLAEVAGYDSRVLVNIAAGVFILPFFLFSATAGQFADKYERSFLVQIIKIVEIILMIGAAVGFYLANVYMLMVVLFLMGAQSTFFGPIKYSILPQHLREDQLVAANGLIQMGTFLSILMGTICGGLLILRSGGIYWVSTLLIFFAIAGWLASRYIPKTIPIKPDLIPSANFAKETVKIITEIVPRRDIFLSILAISWFWLVGATFLSQFPTYAKLVIGANEQVATLFLAVFSVGIGLGSMACNSLLKGEVSGRYVPWAAVGMSIASVLLYFFSLRDPLPAVFTEIGLFAFLGSLNNLGVLACLFAVSFFGGLYIVPLYAIIQKRSEESQIASVIACSNIMDSLFMTISAVGVIYLLRRWSFSIPQIFLAMALLTIIAAFVIRITVRDQMRKRGAL